MLNSLPFPIEYILVALYGLLLIFTVFRILLDTDSTPKTLAYLLLVIVVPLLGVIIYFSVGINYRHRSSQSRGRLMQRDLDHVYFHYCKDPLPRVMEEFGDQIAQFKELVHFLGQIGGEYLYSGNAMLLTNGEEKFPEVLRTLSMAKNHIHMEYYAWENDVIGRSIKDALVAKAREGVDVRILYDDYASRGIRKNLVKEMRQAGIKVFPQIEVKFHRFANRINHRDHRKVIVVDGKYGFVGGINLSARYDNSVDTGLYWRDTHVKLQGLITHGLQRHFIISWNACPETDQIDYGPDYFPTDVPEFKEGIPVAGQLVAGGPIYSNATIMLSYLRIFTLARKTLYIANPYFIPSESILNALKQAAFSGVDVRLLLPAKSDSALVGAASRFYFKTLIEAGVRIFLYKKGFIHAKTLIADDRLSVVGTANMDIRSFDLNFEVMSVLYSANFAEQMKRVYLNDLEDSVEVTHQEMEHLSTGKLLLYSLARLVSSFL